MHSNPYPVTPSTSLQARVLCQKMCAPRVVHAAPLTSRNESCKNITLHITQKNLYLSISTNNFIIRRYGFQFTRYEVFWEKMVPYILVGLHNLEFS